MHLNNLCCFIVNSVSHLYKIEYVAFMCLLYIPVTWQINILYHWVTSQQEKYVIQMI